MYEKVNPSHPDKLADRIAGALVDYAYLVHTAPRIAVEVLIGHHMCYIIAETSVSIPLSVVHSIVHRIAGVLDVDYREFEQDAHLAANQSGGVRCGDNGIFRMILSKMPSELIRFNTQEFTVFFYKTFSIPYQICCFFEF